MKMPLAYVTAAWSGDPTEATEQAARYCWAVYEILEAKRRHWGIENKLH